MSSTTEQTVHERIATTLKQWADQHPSPDMPALSLAEMGEFSPRQIYDAVAEKTEVGQFVEVLIVNGVRVHPDGLNGVLQSFVGIDPVAFDSEPLVHDYIGQVRDKP